MIWQAGRLHHADAARRSFAAAVHVGAGRAVCVRHVSSRCSSGRSKGNILHHHQVIVHHEGSGSLARSMLSGRPFPEPFEIAALGHLLSSVDGLPRTLSSPGSEKRAWS